MKSLLLITAFCGLLCGAAPSEGPATIIDRELVAYNARDINAFMLFYAPDCEIYEFPDKLLAKGSEAIRKRYLARFASPNLHAEVIQRIVTGDRVIDHERVTLTFPEGTGVQHFVIISEVKDGVKTRVWAMAGEKTLDKK